MSVTIKNVGKERIHIKETTKLQWWVGPFCIELFTIGLIFFLIVVVSQQFVPRG